MQVTFEDLKYMALTVWGEARGEPYPGKVAVAWVLYNRAVHDNMSLQAVATAKWQFSCWNKGDPNNSLITDPKFNTNIQSFRDSMAACIEVLDAENPDATKGSRHYCVTTLNPDWAKGHTPVYTVGMHKFYNDVA